MEQETYRKDVGGSLSSLILDSYRDFLKALQHGLACKMKSLRDLDAEIMCW